MEVALDFGHHQRVVLAKAVHGLVGKHDAPAEGAVGLVAFEHGDVGPRIGLLHQNRKIQAGRAATQAYDAHCYLLDWPNYIEFVYFISKAFIVNAPLPRADILIEYNSAPAAARPRIFPASISPTDMTAILVTGGAGFIGSALIRQLIEATDWRVVNVDKLTYAGNLESLADLAGHPRHVFSRTDICDRAALDALFAYLHPAA
jgi:hypothetical protein